KNRLRKTDTLLKIGRLINPLLDSNQVLIRATEAAVYLTGAEEGYLLLVDSQSNTLYLRAAQHYGERKAQSYHLPIADTVANTVVQTGKPVLLSRSDGQKYKIQTGHLAKSLLNVPLIAQGEVIGVLGVDNQLSDAVFTESHLYQLTTLADMTAAALASAHQQTELRQALVRRTKELATLQTIAEQLGETSEFELGARLTLALIVQTTNAEAALLAWYPNETAAAPNYISYGSFTEFSLDTRPEARHRRRKWWDEEALQEVLIRGEPVHEHDLHQILPPDRLGASRSRLIVPIRLQEQVVGAINLESSVPNAFSDEDRRFVTIIGNQIAIALKARLQQQKALVQQSSLLPVLQTVNNAIWFVDTDMRLRLQNDAARDLLGWPSSEVLGQHICDLVSPHDDDSRKLCNLIQEAITKRWSLPFPPNMTLNTSHNVALPVGGRITPVMQGTRVTGVVCAFWERATPQSSKKVEQEFANMASHLLRTPLSFIQTSIDLMEGSDLAPAEQQVLLNKMRQQIEQLTEFTNELLKMLNLDREDTKINLQPTEVLPLIEQTLKVVNLNDPRYTFTV
ncbi:MAG: GAF domain-containing protein, partial [Caldilineae bacterium]